MATKNDVTGDSIRSKGSSKAYRDNYDRIFRKKKTTTKKADDYQDILSTEDCVLSALEDKEK